MKRKGMELLTNPEPCESCGSRVAVTRQTESGGVRLSNIGPNEEVLPGPHSPLDCQSKRR